MLSGCNEAAPDPKAQVGEKPDLPALQQYLIPPMHVASVVGWKSGQKPSVPRQRNRTRSEVPLSTSSIPAN